MKNLTVKGLGAGLAALSVFAYTASAQLITYVDATHGEGGNTTMTDGSVWEPTTAAENTGGWNNRAFANNSTIYENAGTSVVDDAHPLRTTVSGLDADTYNVYVYFWSSDDGGFPGSWPIRATLDGDAAQPWPLYNPGTEGDVTVADPGNFTDTVMTTEGNRTMFQAHLGQVTGTEYSIFIDDLPKTSTDGSGRTWYDGVGHSVVPEPSTYALFAGLAVFAVLALRKRRR